MAGTIRAAHLNLINNTQVQAVVEEIAETRLTALPKGAQLINNLRHQLHLPILLRRQARQQQP
jgi:hypothetical protein